MARRVLITGGNRGIGLAIARRFQQAGDTVAVTYRSEKPPEDVQGIHCEVTDTDSVDGAVSEFEALHGPVEVLVANAGITRDKLLVRMSDEDILDVLDTNLAGAFRLARRVSLPMMRARWGRMVFISSVVDHFGAAGQTNYAAAKSGLLGLARSLAWEYGSRQVTANVISPGLIDTDMTRGLSDSRKSQLLAITPLGRVGQPDEVAHAVRFVASEEAGFITGALIPVGGGLAMGH